AGGAVDGEELVLDPDRRGSHDQRLTVARVIGIRSRRFAVAEDRLAVLRTEQRRVEYRLTSRGHPDARRRRYERLLGQRHVELCSKFGAGERRDRSGAVKLARTD